MLYYKEFGQGFPIIILHGLYGSSDNWVTIAKKLASEFRVIIPDQRNHGRSFHAPEMNFEILTDDLYNFINELNLNKVHLLGHSMGGKVASNYIKRYPENVDKLIMVDVSPFNTKPSKKVIKFHQLVISILCELNLEDYRTRQELKKDLTDKLFSPPLVDFLMKNFYIATSGKFDSRINIQAIKENIDVILGDIDVDNIILNHAIIIKGGDSDYFKINDFDNIRKKFPNIELAVIENTTHWLHAEKPNEFYRIVKSFLKRDSNFTS